MASNLFGQTVAKHDAYFFDANEIKETVFCLCNSDTKNIPTGNYGLFVQLCFPYEGRIGDFRLQIVFESIKEGDKCNAYWRTFWNDIPKGWRRLSSV